MGAILIYVLICVVGFYMGFSLEPHQQAYETALQAEFTDVTAAIAPAEDQEAFDDLIEKCRAAFREENAAGLLAEYRGEASDPAFIQVLDAADAFLTKNGGLADAFNRAVSRSTVLFWAMAVLVGTVQGGIQAVSRSYFGKLIPKERSNEFFGFFDIFGKFASVLGPFLYSLIGGWTGRSSYGVLCLMALFLVGFFILNGGKKELDALESGK